MKAPLLKLVFVGGLNAESTQELYIFLLTDCLLDPWLFIGYIDLVPP